MLRGAEGEGGEVSSNPVHQALRAVARFIVTVGVVIYTVLDELLFPLVRPLLRWLGELQLFQRLGALIGRLPPYVVLVCLAVPFVVIEPLKLFSVYWIAIGHVATGVAILIAAHLLSLLTVERLYHAGYGPLMQIGWFRALMGWLVGLRDRALAWVRATRLWQSSVAMVRSVRAWLRGLLASLR